MKILWFTNTPCGAAEKLQPNNMFGGGWLVSLEKELVKEKSIELHVAFYWNENLQPFELKGVHYHPVYRDNGSKIQRLFDRCFRRIPNDEKELSKLLRIVNEIKPSLIHIHGTEDNFGLINSKIEIPILLSIQGLLLPYYQMLFVGIPENTISKQESLNQKLFLNTIKNHHFYFNQRALREKKILLNSLNVMGRTTWDKSITQLLAPKSNYYIGNEILRDSFYQKNWEKKSFEKCIQLITITSDSFYKGFETIVDTALLLNEYNLQFHWKVIGLTENSECVKIVKNWKKFEYKEIHIELLGKKNENEISDLLLKSDIYIQTSHIENSPNSLCEAMMIGIPIIASNVGGTSSLLINEKDGQQFQNSDFYSLAGLIKSTLFEFEKASVYAKNAREKAKNRHNKEKIVAEIIEIYKRILNNEK
ncbi:MAG: glycosyltransferase [Bacteroidota bacterium]